MNSFLVDVYAIGPQGQDLHLGGGIFRAGSASEAEAMAASEYGSNELSLRGFDIAFMTDVPDVGSKGVPLAQLGLSLPGEFYA
ncbi:hypothetical protein [Halomonas halocynthiae]|uniref:hypothetical protein n=1 Tax=Halomonas halocynthiae TaxID=176290 RepID=UPI000407B98C|nr:hypothetical protein [Halomonas halocynthiae]